MSRATVVDYALDVPMQETQLVYIIVDVKLKGN